MLEQPHVALPPALEPAERLRFAWWNTGISPRRGKKEDSARSWWIAEQIVRDLFNGNHVDFLGLGEVGPDDVSRLRDATKTKLKVFADASDGTGLAAIYNSDRLRFLESWTLTGLSVDKVLKRSCHLHFKFPGDFSSHIFLCHWPSRLRGDQAKSERRRLADDVTIVLRSLRQAGQGAAIVMGDFNDEPFDLSVQDGLQASRDRSLVRKRTALLYNPFWRHLGERQYIHEEEPQRLAAGTCYFASDQSTHWFTFDQIIVSGQFLGRSEWLLSEPETAVMQTAPLLRSGGRLQAQFDHFPVVMTLHRGRTQREQ